MKLAATQQTPFDFWHFSNLHTSTLIPSIPCNQSSEFLRFRSVSISRSKALGPIHGAVPQLDSSVCFFAFGNSALFFVFCFGDASFCNIRAHLHFYRIWSGLEVRDCGWWCPGYLCACVFIWLLRISISSTRLILFLLLNFSCRARAQRIVEMWKVVFCFLIRRTKHFHSGVLSP